jgi:hypothetical protein
VERPEQLVVVVGRVKLVKIHNRLPKEGKVVMVSNHPYQVHP